MSTFLSRIRIPLAGWLAMCATACLGWVCVRMHRKQPVDSFVLPRPLSFPACEFTYASLLFFLWPLLVLLHSASTMTALSKVRHTHTRALFFNVVLTLCIAIQRVAIRMRAYPYSSIILGLMILATSTPPMLGFTFLVTLSGFVYGFPQGVAPAMIGKSVCTFVSREQWHSYRGSFIDRWLRGSYDLFRVR